MTKFAYGVDRLTSGIALDMARRKTHGVFSQQSKDQINNSSQAIDQDHAIAPFHYQGEKSAALMQLTKVIDSAGRSKIVRQSDDYLHIE